MCNEVFNFGLNIVRKVDKVLSNIYLVYILRELLLHILNIDYWNIFNRDILQWVLCAKVWRCFLQGGKRHYMGPGETLIYKIKSNILNLIYVI